MSSQKAVKCKICGKKYVNKQALIDHIDKTHGANIPEGWNAARYENFLRTGKTEGRCVYCHSVTGWNNATGKYNRMCGSEKCKKTARDIANKNYIGLHGKPYSINNPEQQKKMVYGRKNSGKYIFEGEDGKKYVAMYDSSYGRDFFEMIDTLLSWDGSDIIAPSPHTYWYEYEGKKHFYIPDAYSTSLNLEIEFKDGGNNPNNHPKIQAVDKIKEKKKDEVMDSLKDQVNYIKICNKDYTDFFAMLSRLKQKDVCQLPKWDSKLESITESTILGLKWSDVDWDTCFGWYHLEKGFKENPVDWEDDLYFKDLDSAIRDELSRISTEQKNGGVIRYVYTRNKEGHGVPLGTITIRWYDYWDHIDPQYEFFWESYEDVDFDDINMVTTDVQESVLDRDDDSQISLSKSVLRRQYELRNPLLNYNDLVNSYRKKLFHKKLSRGEWMSLYNELIYVKDYLTGVVNGGSEEDQRMSYEATKALKQIDLFIQYMEDKDSVMETSNYPNGIKCMDIRDSNAGKYINQSPIGKHFNELKSTNKGEIFVDTSNDKFVGCIFVGDKRDKGFISNLWVSPKYRKHGYGSKLLDDAMSKYGGYDLTVKKDNQIAVNMYKNRGFVAIEFKNSEGNPYYWMKPKSKLTDKDKVVTEPKDIFTSGDLAEYREFADLNAARIPTVESDDSYINSSNNEEAGSMESTYKGRIPNTVSDYSKIAKAICEKTKRDEKEPVGNQNCQLCTWCFEANIRGIKVLPRPVYSPRDIIFSYNGYDIVKNPVQVKIKSKDDVVNTLLRNKSDCRYYVHVNWKNSTSGHEFMIVKLEDKIYVLDGQAGLVSDINSSKSSNYFKNANFNNSYMIRMDDKDFNNELLTLNDDSYIVDWVDGDEKLLESNDYKVSLEATYIEATKDDTKYYPVFVFLSFTGTNMSKLIRAYTHDPYAHSSLSFDTELTHMVSFNAKGMVDENIFDDVYKKYADSIRYSLYAYMATADEYDAMREFVDQLLGKRSKLKYNALGLTNFIFGRGSERENRFFCSEFIASAISAGNNNVFNKKPYMISPCMLVKNKNFVFIKTGILKHYDSKVVDKIVAEKLEEGGYTNVIIKR